MTQTALTADRIAELLVHVGRLCRNEDGTSDLTAAQWTCLRFFARANGSTRTPSAFASFQATTRGTASQIIKGLETRGLIVRRRSESDGRSVRFDLTEAGRACLVDDPLGDLIALLEKLEAQERAAFLDTLSGLSSSLALFKGARAFGTCGDCTHFTPGDTSGYCACMAGELGAGEIDQLCASYAGRTTQKAPQTKEGHDDEPA
ncbi:MarR family transcriptional regulator [Rhodobacteraceae bacterium W635]|uniref:MarR family winged helix-turn-helix transcriptional regulator n=1 Tax=Nioella halotolerans TaxID=2303578 RepID=UPI000E3C3822|nr:MarR family transcriptional regulator [Rhodobacteraceae bacterium W635]